MGGKRDYELSLEIGHKSKPLKKKTANNYTHKWTVYLKGISDAKIENCISRVVFQLHESFDNHHRVITEPPYRVKETGYAGFELPIEVYFRNKDKPNHIVYVHNLELLNYDKHEDRHVEKVMFINPNKEFEKCLIKAGARAHISKSKDKKDRSDSPPIKKRKSTSSLIPSKDMGKLSLQPASNGHHKDSNTSKDHHSNHTTSSSQQQTSKSSHQHNNGLSHHNSTNVTDGNSGSSSRSNHSLTNSHNSSSSYHHHQSSNHNTNPHSQSSKHNGNNTQQKPQVPKAKSESKDFVDLFGPPLVYNKKQQAASNQPDVFQTLQSAISGLTDSDRLQKIVDIIEESGEWFNLTPKKFEFDLKRLDKKTLHKIEKCLH